MILLNLLSPEQKEGLRYRILFAMTERLMTIAVSLFLFVAIALLAIRIRLTRNVTQILSRQVLSTEYVQANGEIRDLNTLIGRIQGVQRQFTPVTGVLQDVIKRAGPGIAITDIGFETLTDAFHVYGTAATRDDLLAYEASLRASPYLKNLESPITNLLQKTGVNFQFQAVLDPAALQADVEP